MVAIVADSPVIEKEIRNLLDILMNAGCGFHSSLVIHEKDGGLSIKTAEPMEDSKEIIRLPRTVLMPGDQYTLEIKGKDFVVHYPENSIVSDLQRRVIDKMYEIYNLTNKVELHEQYSFLFSLQKVPDLIARLGEGRDFLVGQHADWLAWLRKGPTEAERHKILIETYVKTRPLGYSDPIRESSVSMIMPVLDFMNHNWHGGVFTVGHGSQRKGDLIMHSSQPFKESTECYANYGIMDALDSLVRYDFPDVLSPIVRSVSIDLEGPAGDIIRVENRMGFAYKKELVKEMQDLRRYIPDISFKDGQMVVSHLLLPVGQSKFALMRVLNLILRTYNTHYSKTMTEPEMNAWKLRVQQAVIEKNLAWYNDLLGFIDALPSDQKETFGVTRVKDVAQRQLKRLGEYEIRE